MDKNESLNSIYKNRGLAPWTYKVAHPEIIRLAEQKIIKGKSVLEIGCGEGTHAIYLANQGYRVTGIDECESAIGNAQVIAKKNNTHLWLKNRSLEDYLKDKKIHETIIDWRVMHEITDIKKREEYIDNISKLLLSGGRYITSAFCSSSSNFGQGSIRKTETGIPLYFASLSEMENLISKQFNIIESRIITVPQKPNYHIDSYMIIADKK